MCILLYLCKMCDCLQTFSMQSGVAALFQSTFMSIYQKFLHCKRDTHLSCFIFSPALLRFSFSSATQCGQVHDYYYYYCHHLYYLITDKSSIISSKIISFFTIDSFLFITKSNYFSTSQISTVTLQL